MRLEPGDTLRIASELRPRTVTYVMGSDRNGWHACFKNQGAVPLGEVNWEIVSRAAARERGARERGATPPAKPEATTAHTFEPAGAPTARGELASLEVEPRHAFDAYVMVDWSANSTPKSGPDSLWWALVARTPRGLRVVETSNPRSRPRATREIRAVLGELTRLRASTLVGFDFPYGYPRGFAAALGLTGPSWSASWAMFAREISDDQERGVNNRFSFASSLNERMAGAGPFWGCPPTRQTSHLGPKLAKSEVLPDKRAAERAAKGAKTLWQLFGNGAVGSQTLLGLPCLHALRSDAELSPISRVWPFETGAALPPRTVGEARIVHAEIYPSIERVTPEPGQVKDEAQVIAQALAFARRDEQGTLADLFEAPAKLSRADLAAVLDEEGWILGVKPA